MGAEGFTWTAVSDATTATTDWSVGAAAGAVTPAGDSWAWSLTATFPGLTPAAELTVAHGPDGGSGELTAGTVVVATIDEVLGVTLTGECP